MRLSSGGGGRQSARMKRMVFLLPMLTVLNAWALEGELPLKSYKGSGHTTFDLGKPELTDSDKRFTWRMWFICKGTRSEGEHGVILENRKLIHGTKLGEMRVVNGKEYVWCGSWDERTYLFCRSGWLPRSDVTSDADAKDAKAKEAGAKKAGE